MYVKNPKSENIRKSSSVTYVGVLENLHWIASTKNVAEEVKSVEEDVDCPNLSTRKSFREC